MKKNDYTAIVITIIISAIFSNFLINYIFVTSSSKNQKAEIVEPITADFNVPDARYFNENSIDPTQIIRIIENNNQQPFNQ